VPNVGSLLEAVCDASERTTELLRLIRDYKGDEPQAQLTYERLDRILAADFADGVPMERLRELKRAHYLYDEVVSTTLLEPVPTFDFTMPVTHSFVVNGIITHNSNCPL
jgi:intein/homing endonuclease